VKIKRKLTGSETGADVRMVQRALNKAPSQTVIAVTSVYDETTQRRMRAFRVAHSLLTGTHFDQPALDKLWPWFDAYGRVRYRLYQPPKPAPPVPELGPIVAGGHNIVDMRLTHETDGIAGYPAFDDGWVAGRHVVAPERVTITEQSGAQGGDAFYAKGDSGMRYWIGHVLAAPPSGRTYTRGQTIATLANLPSYQGGPHVHLGCNARSLGVELHATGYGAGPTLGDQLRAGLDV
jgi:peptidoglycan hydrolase-like protein with peptidoglycan-binding domain